MRSVGVELKRRDNQWVVRRRHQEVLLFMIVWKESAEVEDSGVAGPVRASGEPGCVANVAGDHGAVNLGSACVVRGTRMDGAR